jgi:uncharacterized protein (DUF4213/DUF364 family)
MDILNDLLSVLDYDAPVADIRQGPFQTAVLTRHCGLASTPHDPGPHHDKTPVAGAGSLLELSALELAHLALSTSQHEAAIGMAAINSLIDVDDSTCVELNAADLITRKGEGKRVAIVGHFPFIEKLRPLTKELSIIEKNPQEGDFPESDAARHIPYADVVGITGTAFTNHTIEPLLELCDPDAFVVVLGGTAPLSTIFFDYGIDAVSGTLVVEPESVLRCVIQGATFRQIKGIRLLTMLKERYR